MFYLKQILAAAAFLLAGLHLLKIESVESSQWLAVVVAFSVIISHSLVARSIC